MITTTPTMTHSDILFASRLIDGCRHGLRCEWAVNGDVRRVNSGVLRAITDEAETGNYGRPDRDIRKQWVRISGTFENWLPVSEVIDLMRDGLFIITEDQ